MVVEPEGTNRGYDNAIYSGIIGSELGNVLKLLIEGFPHLEGLYNLASIPISKYDLLKKLQRRLGREDIEIAKNTTFYCDRSLNGSEFSKITGYEAPSWDQMIDNLSKEIEDEINKTMFKDKTLLITGGTGSFGETIVKKFINTNIGEIRIFSRDEKKQEDMRILLNDDKIKFYIGDVRDYSSLSSALYGVDYVFTLPH